MSLNKVYADNGLRQVDVRKGNNVLSLPATPMLIKVPAEAIVPGTKVKEKVRKEKAKERVHLRMEAKVVAKIEVAQTSVIREVEPDQLEIRRREIEVLEVPLHQEKQTEAHAGPG